MLAGTGGFEDAGVVRLDADRALVLTTDFFPPIVDDPRWFGRIAAANSLSDVYAMGAQAFAALNLVAWPKDLDAELLAEMLAGGMDKIREAGAALAGGHTVTDHEIKYGLAVTGLVHPDRFWRNSNARAGDRAILTKRLGTGAVSTAIKKQQVDEAVAQAAVEQMALLHKESVQALAEREIHAVTDVTGFGLFGHGREMADAAGLTFVVDADRIPLLDGALALAEAGLTSGAAKRGRAALGPRIGFEDGIEERFEATLRIAFDAETSGGLLIAVPEHEAEQVRRRLVEAGAACAVDIGSFVARRDDLALVVGTHD